MMSMTESGKGVRPGEDITSRCVKLVACSDLRRDIVSILVEGKKPLSEIRDRLGVRSSTAIHALRELEKENIILQYEDRDYGLTQIGEIIARKVVDLTDTIDVLKKHEEFWLTHDLTAIPEHLLDRIGDLKDSILLKIDPLSLPHKYFTELLAKSTCIKGISPIFFEDYPKIFTVLLDRGVFVELILTEAVLERVKEEVGADYLKTKSDEGLLKIYTLDDIKIAFTVSDTFLSLGLFKPDGTYDITMDLVNENKKALQWGIDLFNWYKSRAKKKYG